MASIFVNFEHPTLTVKGESIEQKHPDWVVLKAAGLTVTRAMPEGARAAQRTRGETELSDFDCTMDQNRASLKLMQSAASGIVFTKVTVHFTRAGDDTTVGQETYLEYVLYNVMIVEYATSGSGEDVPEDTFKLNYTKIDSKYLIANEKGKLSEDSTFGWDKEKSQMG